MLKADSDLYESRVNSKRHSVWCKRININKDYHLMKITIGMRYFQIMWYPILSKLFFKWTIEKVCPFIYKQTVNLSMITVFKICIGGLLPTKFL